jgi:hypothetical protein
MEQSRLWLNRFQRSDLAAHAYADGVPMGGNLASAPSDKGPGFLVQALRDPDGANLDRIQIIKGWLDADGKPQEHIFDVAVSDGRHFGVGGRSTPAEAARDTAERATGGK